LQKSLDVKRAINVDHVWAVVYDRIHQIRPDHPRYCRVTADEFHGEFTLVGEEADTGYILPDRGDK
jgi:hypothetical protein